MRVVLARTEGNCRNAMPNHPVAVETAVRDPHPWLQAGSLGGPDRLAHYGRWFFQAGWVVVQPRTERKLGRSMAMIADLATGFAKCLAIGACDRAGKRRVMAPSFAADVNIVGYDIGRHPGTLAVLAAEAADIRRPRLSVA